jgi:hypothetical protein
MNRTLTTILALLALPATAFAVPQPDYTATLSTSTPTVAVGGDFTRTLIVTNQGLAGGVWPVTATINQVQQVSNVRVVSTGFERCGVYPFRYTTSLNYVRCFNAFLAPGQSASMTVTYTAITTACAGLCLDWIGWLYRGGGSVSLTAMELDSNPTNNYSTGPTTLITN